MIDKLLNAIFGEIPNEPEKECDCCKCNCKCDCDNECDCDCGYDDIKLDLKNDEDYDYFKNILKQLREGLKNDELNSIYKLFLGDNVEEMIDLFDEIGESIHNDKKHEKKTPELPSSKTPINKQQQIHKLVAEYVDTIIKPNTDMDSKVINDVYAGLFEFACWIMNK